MKFWRWLKKWAWLVLAATAFVTGVVIAVSLGKGRKHSPPVTSFAKRAAAKVMEVEAEVEAEKEEVRRQAAEEKGEVEEIRKDPETRRRRRRVAEWIAEKL